MTPLHLLQNSTPHLLFSNANHSKQCLYFHNCFSSQSSDYWRKARCCCQQKRKPAILLHHWEILEVCPDDLKKHKCQEPQTCMPCHPQWAVYSRDPGKGTRKCCDLRPRPCFWTELCCEYGIAGWELSQALWTTCSLARIQEMRMRMWVFAPSRERCQIVLAPGKECEE